MNKTLIAQEDRMTALPRRFGSACVAYEMAVYNLMTQLTNGAYSGGSWDFYTTENGGFFMQLTGEGDFTLSNEGNYTDTTMSREAACVAVNLYACSHLSFKYTSIEALSRNFQALYAYAAELPEAGKIFTAID